MLSEREIINSSNDVLIKSFAYDALIEHNITELPVPIKQLDNVSIFSMQLFLRDYTPAYCDITRYAGVLMRLGGADDIHYIIMYNEDLSEADQRWAVSKLFYYIKSGIADMYPGEYINCDSICIADSFAAHYTCPDIVLDECNLKSAQDVLRCCDIPFKHAVQKSKYLKGERSRYIFSSLEKALKENFKLFIRKLRRTN